MKDLHDIAILRRSEVSRLTGRSFTSLRRDMENGEFPQPVALGARAIGWRAGEVRAWLESRQVAALPAVPRRPAQTK